MDDDLFAADGVSDDDPDGDEWEEEEIAPARESFLAQRPGVVSFLPVLVLAGAIAAISVHAWQQPDLQRTLAGNIRSLSDDGEYYRVFSSMFVHKDALHLVTNLVFLVPLGGLLTAYYGLAIFPLLAAVIVGLTHWLVLMTYPPHTYLIGVSGLVYVLFGLWISLMFFVEAHLPWTKRLLRIMGFSLIMFIPSTITPAVSYRTHLVGLVLGLVSGVLYGFFSRRRFMIRNEMHRLSFD